MDKIERILAVLLIIILALTTLTLAYSQQTQNQESPLKNNHSWTKAICDKNNLCQDYEIKCNGKTLTSISPITGAFIQQDTNWQDPRSIEQRTRFCD